MSGLFLKKEFLLNEELFLYITTDMRLLSCLIDKWESLFSRSRFNFRDASGLSGHLLFKILKALDPLPINFMKRVLLEL